MSTVSLTDFVVGIPHGAGTPAVRRAYSKADVDAKFAKTAWAKTLAQRKTRASLSDFDRFKVLVNRKERSKIVNTAFNKLRRPTAAAGAKKPAAAAPKKAKK